MISKAEAMLVLSNLKDTMQVLRDMRAQDEEFLENLAIRALFLSMFQETLWALDLYLTDESSLRDVGGDYILGAKVYLGFEQVVVLSDGLTCMHFHLDGDPPIGVYPRRWDMVHHEAIQRFKRIDV